LANTTEILLHSLDKANQYLDKGIQFQLHFWIGVIEIQSHSLDKVDQYLDMGGQFGLHSCIGAIIRWAYQNLVELFGKGRLLPG
jgi:hypothetical protein